MSTSAAFTAERTSRTVTTPDGDLHYHEAGDGPPLVLLHGSGPGVKRVANFGETLTSFAEEFRCLALDIPGFGRSYDPELPAPLHGPNAVVAFLDASGSNGPRSSATRSGATSRRRSRPTTPERVSRLVTMGGVGLPS
ncbi:MAG: alpha/beta hydrolase [Acidimicrobiales bacterium]